MISPASFLSACGTIATPEAIHCALAVLRTSQSHLETEESLSPIPLATQLQDSKLCLDGGFSSKFLFVKHNLLAIYTGDQKGAGEEHSKGSFYITPLDGKNIPNNIPPRKERHDNFQINLVGVATLT